MKGLMIPIIIMMLSLPALADEETLISGKIESGGYGGVEVKFGEINGEWEVLVGGRGGWIINHKFALGGAGYGMATHGEFSRGLVFPGLFGEFNLGYGGVLLAYINNSDKLVHLNIEALIGGGGISNYNDTYVGPLYSDYEDDAFFIFEPGVNFELNITRKIRFGFGAGYRITSGVDYWDLDDSDISGPSLNLMMKFGKF